VLVQVGIDPTVTGVAGAGMLSMTVPSGLIGQGWHAPIGTVDSTAMGPLGQAPIGSLRPTGGCLQVPSGS